MDYSVDVPAVEVNQMASLEWYEAKILVAAEEARRDGFYQTHLALLDVLRTAKHSNDRALCQGDRQAPTLLHSERIAPST